MRLLITSFVILFGLSSPSFSEETNIRELEWKEFGSNLLLNRMCIGGFEFVVLCKNYFGNCIVSDKTNIQMTQIITEEGGGKKC